jgi:3-keto-5-aminohexanoate cleavage enzyme
MQPLIITATANICWLAPDEIDYPRTPEAITEESLRCMEAGATLIHTHAEGNWVEVIKLHRERCGGLILQCGMSSLPIPERMVVFENHPDMMSIIISHHDEAFAKLDVYKLHSREELAEYMSLCLQYRVRPELEVWNTGSIWNMRWLIEQGLLKPPYFATLFFGWPGGQWSPPTVEEYLYRRKCMPPGSVLNVSIMGEAQMEIVTAAIAMGDHIRIGTEDYPYDLSGKPVPTHELVAAAAHIAHSIGRPLATIEQAREIVGLPYGANDD